MAERTATLAEVLTLARGLSRRERIQLIVELAAALGREWQPPAPVPTRSLSGLWADLGPAPSAEEIDEARREAWASFPREELAHEDRV